MGKRNGKTVRQMLMAVLLAALILPLFTPLTVLAEDIPHGTADFWVPEEMLDNEPPQDYKVNKETQGEAKDGKYNAYFLKDAIQTVEITIDENNLNYLLQNAADEPYVMTESVTIGDATLGYCGLKTKGAFTLEHSVTDNAGSDRFSFTINFGKYIKKKDYGEKQNFFGANKISFNNFFFDKSMMKEFFALMLLDEMGLPTPQYGLAKLYINGNYYGVYAMVEAMDESILEQYYGVDSDELSSYLCKPEGTVFDYYALKADDSPLWEYDEDTKKDVEDMLPTVMEWVRKLNHLNYGTDFDYNVVDVNSEEYLELLGQVIDIDEVVKYFAVHSWLCQMDNMFVGQKNFGLYVDKDGKALIVPWDYDLSFGCYYPSTAELTANYHIDAMFRLSSGDVGDADEIAAETYAGFPLFNVIYQNDALMEQYHAYMKECSKIVALGGTVESTGKTYEPGYFNSVLETLKADVLAAATEKTAKNVYYMNNTRQPRDVRAALPNLAEILAMRSAGVYVQVAGIETTVCGQGCDLSALGNAVAASGSVSGKLTIVDEKTGIFASGTYTGDRRSGSPTLTVNEITSTAAIYGEIVSAIGLGTDAEFIAYAMAMTKEATSGYKVYIPVSQDYMQVKEQLKFYSYTKDGGLTELTGTWDDNLFTAEVAELQYIAVVKSIGAVAAAGTNGNGDEADVPPTQPGGNSGDDVTVGKEGDGMKKLVIIGVSVLFLLGLAGVIACGKKGPAKEEEDQVTPTIVQEELSEKVITPNEGNIKVLGRADFLKNTLWMVHSGSGAEFTFTGTKAVVTLQADSAMMSGANNQARVAIFVNGECVVDDMINKMQKTYTVFESEEEKECVVRIIKLSEAAMSTVGIVSIEVTARGGIKPTENKAHLIEFIGDSITCGYGVEDEDPNHNFKTSTENAMRAYAYKTAEALGADYRLVSFSGWGIISGYTGTGEAKMTEQLVPDYYEKLGFSYGTYMTTKPQDVAWDFTKRQPELIVVNLGTNDDSYTLNFKDRQEEYKEQYVEFLKTIRKNNPEATLLCTLGIMGGRLFPYVEQAVEEYSAQTGDTNIHTLRFAEQNGAVDGLAADWHPTEKTHTKAAEKLTEKIREIMGW